MAALVSSPSVMESVSTPMSQILLGSRSSPTSLSSLSSLDSLPPDVVNIISANSNRICCEGKIQTELIDLQVDWSTHISKPQFHESNIIVVTKGRIYSAHPVVRVFEIDGKEKCQFEIAEDEQTMFNFKFALIGNNIFLSMMRFCQEQSDNHDFIVVYDLQGNFKNQWPTTFDGIKSFISFGQNILLSTRDKLCIQVFDQYGNFSRRFGDYELWSSHPTMRCSLSKWTNGRVIVSYWDTHELYNANCELIQVFTFQFGSLFQHKHENYHWVDECITQSDEIFIFLQHSHLHQHKVLVFNHNSSKIELQRTFLINNLPHAEAFHTFSLPNGSICRMVGRKIYVYQ